ncbi:hypothetical protein [Bacillus sp. UNCCL81]|uniref:hypothetical protein n=1 Tax=Bacillus sp. UNCCL81 TaxID=1502755 RepID=UPI0008F14AC4|nr:hypothetical protein [Bacillus sp. UNCCL81]SFC51804.1 hypothetical protein SAMN02799633_01066 [Bacillus sp. UNCCL81]
MGNEFKRKNVCFNISDPDERKLFEHAASRKNFSRYIKSLIQKDATPGQPYQLINQQLIESEDQKDDDFANQLI